MSTRLAFYRRRFLNRPRHHLGAHVIAEVAVERPKKGSDWVSGSIHLADCTRCITLDFNAFDRAEAANALRKLAVLQRVVAEFETSLRAAIDDVDLAPKKH